MSFRSLASLRVAASFAALLVLSACSDGRQAQLSAVETIDIPAANAGQQTNQNITNPTLVIPDTFPVAEGDDLTLVWNDEFDGPEIDPEVWFFATGDGTEKGLPGGWGNNELQYYLPDNAQIVNGVLEITARRENVGGLNYSSARINTEDRFAFKYGRIEASIKLPAGQGLWPAFWMLSQDSDYLCGGEPCIWAAIGEIDIMEAVNLGGTGGNEIFGTLHHGGEAPANVFTGDTYTPSVDVTESFNTYALEWDEDEIRWYFNGQLYAMQNSWNSSADGKDFPAPFDQNFHVLLNLAVGGNFPGDPNGTTPFPATMEVDWVRVYSGEDPDGGVATEPNASAPTPTVDAAGVISVYSDAYDDIAGVDYNPPWNQATVFTEAQIAGNKMLKYAGLDYQGIDFAGNPQDVSGKGYLHLDFWTADSTALNVYLISLGAETPYALPVTPNSWVSVDVLLSEFTGVDLTNVIQLKFDGNGTIFVDNLYFGGEAPVTAPTAAASTPTEDAGDVVSLFSNAYTDVTVGDFSTTWDTADVSDVQVDGDDVKLYVPTGGGASLGFIGINFDNANAIDGTGYDTLRMDIWTPDVTNLLVKLVDFGGDGFEGANADTTGTSTQTLSQGSWQTISIPFSEFITNGLAGVTELSQIVLEDLDGAAGGTTLYVDNLYFFNSAGAGGGGGTAPTAAATTPTEDAGDVVSLFSNAYTDVAVGDFSTTWDTADVSDVQVDGDDVKLYVPTGGGASLGFIGINFDNANAIDGTGYDTLRMDIWTPDVTNLLVKLVDFGGDGFEGANADTTGTSTQTLSQGSWQTISIPFSEFIANGLAGVTELSQIVLEDLDGAAGGTALYVDNLYFFNSAGSSGGGGTVLVTFDEVPQLTVNAFGGSVAVIETGPAGGDGSNALNILRDGGEPWAGVWVTIPAIPSDAGTQTVSALVYSPTAGIPMVAKAEYGENAGTGDVQANETVVVGWQTLSWTFTNLDPAQVYNRFVMLPNLGTVDTATSYFFDNITLLEAGGGGGDPFDGGLLTNGDFEDGVGGSWIGNALNVVDDGGNFVNSANVEAAGNPFDVNLSQVLTITQDETYTLTFKARSDGARTMLAGIGLNEDPFTNFTEVVNLTAEWQTFEFEFTATGFGNANSRVLFDMGADTGLVLIDDVSLVVTTGGGGGATGDIAINGGFETGLFNDGTENASWQQFPGGGIQAITTDNPSSGTYAANLIVPVRTQTDPAVDNLIKNANLQAGNLTPGTSVTVSFDMRGSLSGAGGVVFAEFFSELSGGGTSKAEIFTGGPLAPTPDWTTYSYTTTLGPDVSGGATLQLKASCGPVEGCGVDVFFDNVSIVIGDTGGDGGGGGGGVTGSCGGVGELAINCGFETGLFNDGTENANWQQFPGGGIQAIITDNPSSGTYAANLNVPVRTQTDPAVDNLIKNANLGAGSLTPGASVTVSFDMRGSLSGAGGVVFAEFFSELSGGGTSKAELFSGGPLAPTPDWTNYSYTTTLGPDVSGGVTLQLKTSCGPVEGCGVDAYFDNVSIVIN